MNRHETARWGNDPRKADFLKIFKEQAELVCWVNRQQASVLHIQQRRDYAVK
jgi:hypothetical protein